MGTHPLHTTPKPPSAYVDESEFERIDGRLISRPMPTNVHARFQDRVKELLRRYLRDESVEVLSEWTIRSPDQASLDKPDYMTPDVLVARVPYEQTAYGHLIRPALLAVEIVSPEQGGLFRKAQRYSAWGVEHVWVINPQTEAHKPPDAAPNERETQRTWPRPVSLLCASSLEEAYEYHGGNTVFIASTALTAGSISIPLNEVFLAPQAGSPLD